MQARDANCRAISTFIRNMKKRGLDVSGLCKGLDVSLAQLESPSTWLDWDTAATILDRIGEQAHRAGIWDDLTEDYSFLKQESFAGKLLETVVGPMQLYRLAVRIITPNIYPYHRATFEKLSAHKLRVVLSVPESGRGCKTFFEGAHQAFETLPVLIGLDRAQVTSDYDAYHGEYVITTPSRLPLKPRLRRWFASNEPALEELDRQQRELQDSYHALREAYEVLKQREQELQSEAAAREAAVEALEIQETQLRQSQKMDAIGQLSGGIAHDFNNHLTVILGYTELLIQSAESAATREYALKIRDSANASSTLTKQLLAFARKQVLQPKVVDLNELVARMDSLLRRTIGEKIDLDFVRGGGLGRVRVDPAQFEQALVNLVINARDSFGNGGGHLTVETANVYLDRSYATAHPGTTPGRHVMLAVSDDGPGIDADSLPMIFEPFFTTKESGTGLGLSTVQGFVAQSGGTINVYSEKGVGTTFKIYLPRVEAAADPLDEEEPVAEAATGTESILVVEDEPLLCELVGQTLKQHGYKVTIARDGGAAVHLSAANPPDLIVTDVVMPGMSGAELVDKLRERDPDVRAVYMSGYTENAIVHRGELDAEVTLLEKPFTARELLTIVRNALDSS